MSKGRGTGRGILGDEQGAALAVALMMLMGLAAMGAAAMWIGSTDLVVAGGQRQRAEALNVAEAGLAEAMYRLSHTPGQLVEVNGNDVDVSITDPSDPPDPSWTARIFNTAIDGAPGSGSASELHTGTIQPADGYMQYSHASDRDDAVVIRHKLRDFDGDGTNEIAYYDPSQVPPENPTDGSPIERITVTGRAGKASRTVQADVIRVPLNPNIFAGLMADGEVDLRGNVTVCGHNHRIDTPPGQQLPNCSPAWDEAAGNLYGVMTTGDAVGAQGSTDLLGSPSPTSTDAANDFLDIHEALGLTAQEWQEIRDNADRNALTGGGPWDGITVVDGNLAITGGSGSGLLYVTGDMRMAGGFTWTGLVYVEGELRNNGNTWILGGVMARGGGSTVAVDFGAGTPAILYSRQALVQTLSQSMDYVILSWKELD